MGGMTLSRRQAGRTGLFAPGTLLERIRATSAAALSTKALEPIETSSDYLEDRGIRFLVRVVSSLRRKPPQMPTAIRFFRTSGPYTWRMLPPRMRVS